MMTLSFSSVWPMCESTSSTLVLMAATSARCSATYWRSALLRAPMWWTLSTSAFTARHHALAPGDAVDLLVHVIGQLLELGDARFERADLLLRKRQLRTPLLELLEHRLDALELIV